MVYNGDMRGHIRARHSAALVGANAALNALKVRLSLSPDAIARCISTSTPSVSAAAGEEEEGQKHRQASAAS